MAGKRETKVIICSVELQYGGGAELVTSVLLNELKQRYESVELLLYFDGELCYDLLEGIKVTVVESKTHTKNKAINMLWIRRYLRDNADCVISFVAKLNILILTALMGVRIIKIVADRSDPYRVPENVFLRKMRDLLYCTADTVVVQSRKSYEYFSPTVQRKTKIIYNPTSVKKEDRGLALRTKKQDLVVCVARMMPVKGPFILLSAFEMFHERFPSYRLIWFGEGKMREEMERWITNRRLEDCVQMPGNRKNIIHEIASAKMFIMTSKYEGMPNALIEAMSIGLPCICTKIAGAEELIESGENGVLVPVGGVKECCEAMTRLAEDEAYAERLGRNAAEAAEALDVGKIMGQWMEILPVRR